MHSISNFLNALPLNKFVKVYHEAEILFVSVFRFNNYRITLEVFINYNWLRLLEQNINISQKTRMLF